MAIDQPQGRAAQLSPILLRERARGRAAGGFASTRPLSPVLLVWCCKGTGRVTVYWERQPVCIHTVLDRCTGMYGPMCVHADKYMYIHVGITYVYICYIYVHYSICLTQTS